MFPQKTYRSTHDEGKRLETDPALKIWRFHGELVLGSLMRERFVSRGCTQSSALLRFMQINNTEQTMSHKTV